MRTMKVIVDGVEREREYYMDRDPNPLSAEKGPPRLKPVLRDGEILCEILGGPPEIFKGIRKDSYGR